MIREIWSNLTLRKKAFIYFSFVFAFIGLLSVVSYFAMSKTYKQFNSVYMNLNILDKYSVKIDKINGELNKYISENDRSYISLFYQGYDELLSEMNNSQLSFVKQEENMIFENIRNMLKSYGKEADEAINEYRKRNLGSSSSKLIQAQKIQVYMLDSINELTLLYISQSRIFQKALLTQIIILRLCIIILTISTILLFLFIAAYFSKAFVKPIDMMVKMADRISHGQYDTEPIKINFNNELKILSDTLFRMSYQIKNNIEEIKQKGEFEKLLQSKEMENLRINALLQETELKRLQAQVNPHFLFNTLTTLHHTAFLEGAEETCEIAQAISKILRYNLRKSNTIVQIKDEIENISYYLYIQEKRYKHRMNFRFEIDDNQMDLPIPNMTIQPIVENAFIHGIENSETGGEIVIAVYKQHEFVVVEVRDNGLGIDKEKLEKIRNLVEEPEENRAHTSSIGINNVVKRLQAFYNKKSQFYIDASPNEGTVIKLYLPADFVYKKSDVIDIDNNSIFLEDIS
jgi:sensor histidine kinase YesM